MQEKEKQLAKNIMLSTILATEEWYSCMLQGELKYLEKKHFNQLMKPLNSYRKKLERALDGSAENYLEHNKEYFINVIQALYDEQIKIVNYEE